VNSGDSHSRELAHKLEALEKKNQEHEVLLKVLLAAVGHPAQPPQEIKRRAVGFQPAESPQTARARLVEACPKTLTGTDTSQISAGTALARCGS